MFFVRYLRRELTTRKRQTLVIAVGLAVAVGLVVTVTAASTGVRNAQARVLKGLYGVGTDVTVTMKPPPFSPSSAGGVKISSGPGGGRVCNGGACSSRAQKIDDLTSPAYGPMSYSHVTSIQRLHGVAAVGGGLSLSDMQVTIPASVLSGAGGALPQPRSFSVTGVDLAHRSLGPLSDGALRSGRDFRRTDANTDVAIADSDYAISNHLKPGSAITIAKTTFTVIGIVAQPQASSPPDIYIPLARAQALGAADGKSLKGKVNTIYVAAASAADIPAVQKEISRLLPAATVNTPASLASQVSGSLASTARLANDLGRWLSVLALIAAFAVAALLSMAAISRRVREFGALKALGWRSWRILIQVMGESAVMGVLGAVLGAGFGFAGAAVINLIAPTLSATLTTSTGQHFMTLGDANSGSPTVTHTVSVPMTASVSGAAIMLAVALALLGALIAGTAASWQIARLRPADALARVA